MSQFKHQDSASAGLFEDLAPLQEPVAAAEQANSLRRQAPRLLQPNRKQLELRLGS